MMTPHKSVLFSLFPIPLSTSVPEKKCTNWWYKQIYLFTTLIMRTKMFVGARIWVINIVWFLILASGSHYFGLTSEYFIVRNHYYFWKNQVYPLGDIKDIIFETKGKAPFSLRLITNDFQSKFYPASPLRNKTWLKLKEELVKMNITVRNEAIPENN